MTDIQKEKIQDMRIRGLGYGTIAKRMGMSVDTVKSHCRRNRMSSKDKEHLERIAAVNVVCCRNCGAEIKQYPKLKKRKFCCDACRNQWWNSHLDQVNRKAIYHIKCANCGKVFEIYGDKRRKYCCHECYIQHRFGGEKGIS